ncbi:MAG: protease modulator HflC [Micavibrio aeruginosavorus]|uniref:Protein HflC n=1 Tax=Micavibrio aeruginosavorus TaxID=349221 RepID=A0A7T5UH95_9BACT|nr:MAG: protease modulator HflC [Micavibrio aeruginosavorus]
MNSKFGFVFILLSLAVIGLSQSLFTVDEREQAIVLHLGEPVGEIKQPGLHFKIPVVQDVRRFDARILAVDPPPEQIVISSSQRRSDGQTTTDEGIASGEPIIVDTFARYRISDPLKFMKTLRTENAAYDRIQGIMNEATRAVLGKRTLKDLLSTTRGAIMADIRTRVNSQIERDNLGIEIVDIRIVRADLTPALRQSTVSRMISELKERATETRAKGEERALEIRSTAEKERTVLLAEAQKESQILRGNGDNEAIKTYAEAMGKDQEFYNFIRSLEAYRNSMANSDTRLILSPDNAFFRHFQNGQ